MKQKNENALIVFLRVPELGKVKTRLAQTLGDSATLAIYQSLVRITLKEAKSPHFNTYLYFFPEIISEYLPESFIAKKQRGQNLGQKMLHAFAETFQSHKRVVIIGTDCPYITTEIIIQAFNELGKKDVVIGPASDGGYYLLGLNHPTPQLFEEMQWSTKHVFDETILRIEKLGFSIAILKTLDDIDFEEDWQRYLEAREKSIN